jgi:cyclopropane fatty-acyl-phospholipid synthase-like methyltransferase
MGILRRLTFLLWYYFNPPWDSGISPPELLEFLDAHEPGRAIDLGCGTGTNVVTLAKRGWQVTGVDFIPRAISIAKRKAKHAGIQADLYMRDVTKLKGITGPFDFALDLGCFHGLGEKKADYISELDRLLAPGGYWLMYGFFTSGTGPGLVETDLEMIQSQFTVVSRQDGFDRHERKSAYFLYQKI